jgi:hypothetical protein
METVENQTAPRTPVWTILAPALIALVGVIIGGFIVSLSSTRLERDRFKNEARQVSVEERTAAYRDFARQFQRLTLDGPAVFSVLVDLGFWEGEGSSTPAAAAERARLISTLETQRRGLFDRYRELADAGTVIDFVGSDRAKKLVRQSEDAARDLLLALSARESPEQLGTAVGEALNKVATAQATFATVLGLELRDLGGLPLDDPAFPVLDHLTKLTVGP